MAPKRKPEHVKKAEQKVRVRRWALLTKYGLTMEEYQAMIDEQNGRCAICSQVPSPRRVRDGVWASGLVVDHNHETGIVRGLLCNGCNRAMGLFKDSSATLNAALAYMAKAEQE